MNDEVKTRKRSNPMQKKNPLKNRNVQIGLVLAIVVIAAIAVYAVYPKNQTNGNPTNPGNPIAVINTTMGTIQVELYTDKAPITTANFIDLANSGYYNGVLFHRVIPNFMIQGGDPNGDGTGGHAARYHEGYGNPNDPNSWMIPDEFREDLSNVRGTISMANHGPNTGGSQFFINVVDNTYLDYNVPDQFNAQHAVFGRVVGGMDIVDSISKVDIDSNNKPNVNIVVTNITIENQ